MRVQIIGEGAAAKSLRSLVAVDPTLVLSTEHALAVVQLVEDDEIIRPHVAGINSALELKIVTQLHRVGPVTLDGENGQSGAVHVRIPACYGEGQSAAVESAIHRGLLDTARPPQRLSRWQHLKAALLLVLLLVLMLVALPVSAQVISVRDSTTGVVVPNLGDTTNKALRVNCILGCGGGVGGGLTDAELRASAVPVSGNWLTDAQLRAVAVAISGTVSISGSVAVTGTFWQATQPVSGTVTIGTFPDNEPFNLAQVNGVTVAAGSGAATTGTLRVTLATDIGLPAGSNFLGNVAVTAFPDNEPINVAQLAGAAVSTAASGVQKVGIVGNAGAALDAANNAAMPANALVQGVQTATIDATPTAATAGNLRYQLGSTEGVTYVQEGGPLRFSCFVQAVTVMTQCRAAPAAGLRAYVTSVSMSNLAATVQTLDVVFGTGVNCATAPTALTHKWQFGTNALTTSPFVVAHHFPTPLVPTAANAICVRPSAATSFGATITGFIAP